MEGAETTLDDLDAKVVLVVNVASKCGLTPQYEQLEELQEKYGEQGFTVIGFPCNQFAGQEPGTNDEIKEFCSTTYGVSFPLADKVKVNGPGRHPLYGELKKARDGAGLGGPVLWNFEKFLLTPDGRVQRFRPQTKPDDPSVVSAIEAGLAQAPVTAGR